jgi:glycerol-3-phosphate dehydrogenase
VPDWLSLPRTYTNFEPRPLDEEVDYLLRHTSYYLTKKPSRGDVLSLFAGLRPLIAGDEHTQARNLPRDHRLFVSNPGLISIAGGKWTTYRKMAQDTIDQAAILGGLEKRPCVTRELRIHGYHEHAEIFAELAHYGCDAPRIQELFAEQPGLARQLHPNLPLRGGEIVWAVREEMAVTVEDVLSRRSRALVLDARAAIDVAPQVAEVMAEELGRNEARQRQQVESFRALATGYLP